MQKIKIARLASMYLTDIKRPVVRKIDPIVKNIKSQICCLYIEKEGFLTIMKGVINNAAIKYLKTIASPKPTPKLYAIFVTGPIKPKSIPAPMAQKVPTICIYD